MTEIADITWERDMPRQVIMHIEHGSNKVEQFHHCFSHRLKDLEGETECEWCKKTVAQIIAQEIKHGT